VPIVHDIAVVGCGVAGQAAATLLADAGHKVTIFERFAEPRPVGAGLLLQPTGLAVLGELGLAADALAHGARVVGLEARSHRGRRILDLAYADLHPAAHGVGIRRSTLFDLLHGRLKRSAARLVAAAEITDIRDARVIDVGGRQHGPFNLIVVADGAHSALRTRLMPQAHAPLYPWGCIWTTVPDRADIGGSGVLRQRVRGPLQMMGLLPVASGLLTIYWSEPVEALSADRPIDLDAWRRTARALWPEATAIIDAADDFARATYRHVALPRWHEGRVLFIGDAAHGTSPQLGQGANLGLLDAYTLAQALAEQDDLGAALALFARRRTAPVRFYRQASHLLTPFFQSRSVVLGLARDLFMGWSCRVPGLRRAMTSTLAGVRRGWLGADRLDEEGRYPLARASAAQRPGVRPKRATK
jgi:2-polyprenyl-6-methoxyphenol hydroxylase-like FAD-dependent oxidoreductase